MSHDFLYFLDSLARFLAWGLLGVTTSLFNELIRKESCLVAVVAYLGFLGLVMVIVSVAIGSGVGALAISAGAVLLFWGILRKKKRIF